MSLVKGIRLTLILLLLVAVMAAAAYFFHQSRPSGFRLPDTPEKFHLADQHARCAGVYSVLHVSLTKGNPNFQELESTFSDAIERHSTSAFKLYLDQEKSRTQIERASAEFAKSIEMAVTRKEDVRAIVDAKTAECIEVEFMTLAFIKREHQSFTASR